MASSPRSPLFVALDSRARNLCVGVPDGSSERLEARALAAGGLRAEFEARRAGRTVVTADADRLAAALGPAGPDAWQNDAWDEDPRDAWVGLGELAAVIAPGPLATGRLAAFAALSEGFAGQPRARASAAGDGFEAGEPTAVEAAARALVRRFLDAGPAVVELAVFCWLRIERGFRESEPATAAWLARVFAVVDHLAASQGSEPPFAATSEARAFDAGLEDQLGDMVPAWTRELAELASREPLPPGLCDPTPFEPLDHQTLERVFASELPALFGARGAGEEVLSAPQRPGQCAVASRIATALGAGELFVAHAPTGTGKTLAYLVPALLWSHRHGVRVGVSTYTRALQDQALEQDLPLARSALARAGSPAAGARVALLKGRDNYLCWRALTLQRPASGDDPETWLAWTYLALFALYDETGDLDRLPLRLMTPALATQRVARELETLLRGVRAVSGCCHATRDRETCGAEVARARAERAHVVITNHAFALARPEFLRNVVFDECEHLHDQAVSAWSHAFGLRDAHRRLKRLHDPSRPTSRAPLDALQRVLPAAGESALDGALRTALAAHQAAGRRLESLLREVRRFASWRQAAARGLHPREEHALLRRFVEDGPSADLLAARSALATAFAELEIALGALLERLDGLTLAGVPRWRRALELFRADLAELDEHLSAWIPLADGRPAFDPLRLHDVEEDARGELRLVARVLAPGEQLGRHYYPDLQSAAFVSATTWLRGGFDVALGYLGLDRTAEPAAEGEEEREPRAVGLFRAPSPFDYARVLVCVPTDAPLYDRGRHDFHAYVRRFLAHLCERTRGRCLALFTNAEDVGRTAAELASSFRARDLPLWYQGMPGLGKEDLSRRFRSSVESTLLGVDTFWYGADFPGETLEYLVLVRLPYGVPDRYHHAQCALYGSSAQRSKVYLPRALAKFRQGFGRLMRSETDRGVVFVLDQRILSGAHRVFLGELPLATDEFHPADPNGDREWEPGGARLVRAPTDECLAAAFEHTAIAADIEARGLAGSFWEGGDEFAPHGEAGPRETPGRSPREPELDRRPGAPSPASWSDPDELPF